MNATLEPVGTQLKFWRQRRRMSQMELALEAEISTRHLSFMESGRATPSRQMLMHLAEELEVPLRERNRLLLAAGYAPAFRERPLADPELQAARQAIDLVLKGHEPFPALAVDRHWNLVAANAAVAPLLAGADPALLQPPMNVLRLSLHPGGLAPRILNLAEWRGHLLRRLRQDLDRSADPALESLLDELRAYPCSGNSEPGLPAVAIPLRLASEQGPLSFISTTTLFGTPAEVTLSELAIEAFYPADAATRAAFLG